MLLLADLAEYQLENVDGTELPIFSDRDLLKSVVDLITASTDLGLQEKVLCLHGILYYYFVFIRRPVFCCVLYLSFANVTGTLFTSQ